MEIPEPITYLTQQQAAEIDQLLLSQSGYTIDQLEVCVMQMYWIRFLLFLKLFFYTSFSASWWNYLSPLFNDIALTGFELQELAGLSVAAAIAEVILCFLNFCIFTEFISLNGFDQP